LLLFLESPLHPRKDAPYNQSFVDPKGIGEFKMTGRGEVLASNAELERFSRTPTKPRVYARIADDTVGGDIGARRSSSLARIPIRIEQQSEMIANLNLMARRVCRWYVGRGTDGGCIGHCQHIQEQIYGTDSQMAGDIPFDKNLHITIAILRLTHKNLYKTEQVLCRYANSLGRKKFVQLLLRGGYMNSKTVMAISAKGCELYRMDA
jgi:hypothetical protein